MNEEEQIILPDGFKRVEFLQSDGNQYIKIDLFDDDKQLNNKGAWITWAATSDKKYQNIFTCLNSDGSAFMTPHWNGDSNSILCVFVNRTNGAYRLNNFNLELGKKYESKLNYLNDGKAFINDTLIGNVDKSLSYTSDEFIVHLFGCNNNGNHSVVDSSSCKIIRARISSGETITHDLIPCLDNKDVPCMYDLVSKQTFYNQGSGKFLTNKSYEWNYPFINNDYNLPSGFKKCVYLQSDGTQWIDTGVIPDNETGLRFNALQLSYGYFVPFGVSESSNEVYPPCVQNNNIYYKWGTSAIKMMTWDKAGDLIFHSSLNLYNSKIAKFDSEDTDVESYITSQTGTYTLPIWLFSYNVNGSFNSTYGKWTGRIYRAQITQGTDLIHDYVPCLDANGRPCMYDIIGGGTVEDNTYYNQSGGTEFAYCVEHQLPSDFVKLNYLESDGTQYIKTGYVPTNTTGLYIDTQDVGGGDTVPMGTRNDTGNTRFFVSSQTSTGNAGYGWGAWTQISTTKGSVRYDSTLNWLNDRKSITNSPSFATIINNLGELPHTPLYGINLFGVNQNNVNISPWKGRIYRAKISEGTDIVRDFVPAYDQRIARGCMYDLINNVAYYNDGEGEFLHNRDFEGTYKGYTGLGCIGNRLGSDYNPIDEKLLSGYTRVEFLEGTSQQAIMTGLRPEKLSSFVKWQITKRMNGQPIGYYNFDESYSSEQAPNNNGTGISTWVTTPLHGNVGAGFYDCPIGHMVESEVNADEGYVRINNKKVTAENLCVGFVENLPNIDLFRQGFITQKYFTGRIYTARFWRDGKDLINFIPAIDPNGKPCMFDIVNKKPFYNVRTNADFIVGLKTISNALQLHLPEKGGTLALSLPTNDKTEYYEEKIRANNPNWTITFQYH